ncbi:uncharacterized protein LOC130429700 [Triplophysa dalaica]|uniref:uncharacterized protein LOC130429700 n=1 Tax=Triplophysa dalaica TaxID=1582913 RepID=UPI0024DF3D8A|nr:uncharacterized protein LOC130429700 [Triplophysa dalaica]
MSTVASCSVSTKPRGMSTALFHTQTPLPADEEDTVWIGFMDIVPVIGMVKEAVDLVLALYEGNERVIKEKEKAIENIVKESLKKHVKLTPPAAVAADDEFSGLRNVREIRKEMIIEYVLKGSKRGTKPPISAEQKERQKKVEDITKDMLEKIRILNPNFKQELTEELKRSKRGEHVFNNSILRFHSNVLTEFIKEHGIYNLRGYNQIQQGLDELGKHTLSQNTEAEIQSNMVVRFSQDEFYVNANGVVYGEYCRALRVALLDVLRHINPGDVTEDERERVKFLIDTMNNFQIYVDELAKVSWIANKGDRKRRFEQVRQAVANMYNRDRGSDWCISILCQVAPLFKQGQ